MGSTTVTAGLAYGLGLSHRTAAEWVRVADALEQLPEVAGAFARGSLSWDQLRAVVSLATSGTDAEWAERAPQLSAAQLEALARHAWGVAASRPGRRMRAGACAGGGTTITGGCSCRDASLTRMERWSSPPSTGWPSRRSLTR